MTELECGCRIRTEVVEGEAREEVELCPMHTAMRQLRVDLESVYTLTTQIKPAQPPRGGNKQRRK